MAKRCMALEEAACRHLWPRAILKQQLVLKLFRSLQLLLPSIWTLHVRRMDQLGRKILDALLLLALNLIS